MKFLEEIAAAGIRSILFAGEGEPLLHPDIGNFIRTAKSLQIDVGLFTNGQLLSRNLAEEILPYLTFIRFSFNSGNRENYSKIHRVKTSVFDKVTENIQYAVEIKKELSLPVDIGCQYVLLTENIDSLTEATCLLKHLGVDYLAIKPFVQQSILQQYKISEPFKMEDLGEIFVEATCMADDKFAVLARTEAFAGYGQRKYSHCYGTSFITVLNSAGDLACCLPYWDKDEFVFGNIYENFFAEIWQGPKRGHLKKRCEDTMDVSACPPNCRANAINQYLYELKHPSIKHLNFI
jgi:radical SAM protein with 4Fe4S-binding SPASM domain